MPEYRPAPGGLALYKVRPALITQVSDKIDIELEGGTSKRVRPKDITLLHPGPLRSLGELDPPPGDVTEAWELLEEGETHLEELAELVFGEYSPASAWAAWRLLDEGLYFEGTPGAIRARSEARIRHDREERERKQAAQREWDAFLQRLGAGQLFEEDHRRLIEVERLALNQSTASRIMQALGRQENPENAHRMLVDVGYWSADHNPHPRRQGAPLEDPRQEVPPLPEEPRLDLTALPAFAIDDAGSDDPDDAISLDGERIWVHVADVAALVTPDSPLDLEARGRGANLYLPEGIVHMLPPAITGQLGLGLQEVSPALSIGFCLDEAVSPYDILIRPSRIRASRHTYEEVEGRMDEAPFATLKRLAQAYRGRRDAAGAAHIDLPEVSVRVREGQILIKPLERLESRRMVTEAMLMAGEAVARYALENGIALPFASQPAPEAPRRPEGMAAMYAYRRQMRPSQSKTLEAPHAGLGLAVYTRATSPLRRYLDLVTHQQLRAYLRELPPMPVSEIAARIGASDAASGGIRRAERLSNTHWKMLYLQRNPGWEGEAVVVECNDNRATVIIPELALETRVRLRDKAYPDQRLRLAVREVDPADLSAWFRVSESLPKGG
ncbi:MAG: RNB domain-containing ribonuclease [Candidatus Sedimenticola endophacoides]